MFDSRVMARARARARARVLGKRALPDPDPDRNRNRNRNNNPDGTASALLGFLGEPRHVDGMYCIVLYGRASACGICKTSKFGSSDTYRSPAEDTVRGSLSEVGLGN